MIRSNSRCQVPFDPERKLGGRGNVRKYYANLIIRQSWRRVGEGGKKTGLYKVAFDIGEQWIRRISHWEGRLGRFSSSPLPSSLQVGGGPKLGGAGRLEKTGPRRSASRGNQRSMLEASNLRQPLENESRAPLDEARRMAGIRFTASRGKENPGLLFSGELSKCNQEILITPPLGSITGCFPSNRSPIVARIPNRKYLIQ